MSRPKIFDEDLFQSLINAGAILPRNLVQELQIRHGLADSHRTTAMSMSCWAMNLKPQAVLAVFREAIRQVSPN